MTAYKMIRVLASDGTPLRKIYCPEDDLERQLHSGETYEEIDPLVDGFGITSLEDEE